MHSVRCCYSKIIRSGRYDYLKILIRPAYESNIEDESVLEVFSHGVSSVSDAQKFAGMINQNLTAAGMSTACAR
jgi:hypothetical protein